MIKKFYSIFIFSAILHGALLFATASSFNFFDTSEKINYAQKSSSEIAIKMVVEKEKKRVLTQKQSTQKSAVKKELQRATDKISNLKKAAKSLGENSIKSLYLSRIRNILEKNKVYPKLAKRLGHEGVIRATFTLAKDGSVIEIKSVSGRYNSLRRSIKTIISKSEFPSFPEELKQNSIQITIPVNFSLI